MKTARPQGGTTDQVVDRTEPQSGSRDAANAGAARRVAAGDPALLALAAAQQSAARRLTAARPASPDYAGPALDQLNRITFELTNIFNDAGFAPIEPAILQPADLLFDLYGEEIWDRAFILDDPERGGLCLRPDFTAPVARSHLRAAAFDGPTPPARYGYFGPVFRRAPEGGPQPLQHLQAGVEIIGEVSSVERDAEIFDISVKALNWVGCGAFDIVTGDLNIVFSLLDALAMPVSWRRRLKRHFWRPKRFQDLLRGFSGADNPGGEGRMAFLRGVGQLDPTEAATAVAEMIALSEAPQIGARTAAEVAERFLRQAGDAREKPLSDDVVALISAVLEVKGPLSASLAQLRDVASGGGVDLAPALERMARRIEALAGRGFDADALAFDAAFGRNLEYYDGFVFEMTATTDGARRLKLGGGGRYDRLFRAMGATEGATGVGAALRPEAMVAAGAGAREAT